MRFVVPYKFSFLLVNHREMEQAVGLFHLPSFLLLLLNLQHYQGLLLGISFNSISLQMNSAIRPAPVNLAPFWYICATSCLPLSSMKVTPVKSNSTWLRGSAEIMACQHFSNSATQGPTSFPA